jgi:acyl-CoA reductase-like NAD-dependent aldehyde dehydrogenase
MSQTVEAVSAEPRTLLLAGVPTSSAESLDVVFPYDGSGAGRVCLGDEAIIEQALDSAAAAEAEVASLPPFRRAEILTGAGELVRSREAELARQMTMETGNAIWETRLEAQRTAEILQIAGEEARRSAATGELVPIDAVPRGEGRIGLTRRFPVGTVLAITPFNAPLLLVAHKLGPALAAGNPCIVRPASKTPLSALSLGEIFLEAGAPPAAVTVVPCRTELAERMVRDGRVKMLSFTGSAEVGWRLQKVAGTPRVTLELGGNGAVIVEPDADLGYVAQRCAFGGFLRAGQACISVQRLYAHSSIVDALQESLLSTIGELRTGNPLDDATVVGGLIDENAAEKAMALIEEAVAAGARVLCGGVRDGTVIAPTLLVDAPESLRVCAEEAFAPIIVLSTYDDVDEAIERANDSPYGLQAGLFTNDIRVINRAFERLEVGALIVNDVNSFRVDQMPYGGAKRSGLGREGMRWAIHEMTEERLLVIDPRRT